jgi:thiamine-monophosphate kinase
MPLSEFELIERYFARGPVVRADVRLGVGDDAAALEVASGLDAVAGLATLVVDHEPEYRRNPRAVGHRALAAALSRVAATGAEPAWATLSLTLPDTEESWLAGFRDGFMALAETHRVQLVGGDTTRGARVVTVIAHGVVPRDGALRRAGARAGDRLYVTGTVGRTELARRTSEGAIKELIKGSPGRLERLLGETAAPAPRVQAGLNLRGIARAAADIPLGLGSGVGEILCASGVGARVEAARLPLEPTVRAHLDALGGWQGILEAGGDLELCFAVAPERAAEAEAACAAAGTPCTWLGRFETSAGMRWVSPDGHSFVLHAERDPGSAP